MKRIALRVSVAALTFLIGITVWMAYLSPGTPLFRPLPVSTSTSLTSTVFFTSFPGLSIKRRYTGKETYFPDHSPEFMREWYSKHLSAMNEPSLYMSGEDESYRFLWLRTFHHPVAVRVWRSGEKQFLSAKQLNGAGGYEPGKLVINQTRPLTRDEWNSFISLLEKAHYWTLPTKNGDLGMDGAQWILEGARDGRYHIVDRWTPDGGEFRELCLYLLEISGLKTSIPTPEIY